MSTRARALSLLAFVAVAAAFGMQTGSARPATPLTAYHVPARTYTPQAAGTTGSTTPTSHYPAARAHHLRRSIAWQRTRTTKLRALIDLAPLKTSHAERHWRSIAALRWLNRKWHARAHHAFLKSRVAVGSVTDVICQVFRPVETCATALTIAYRESRYKTWAWNSSDHGGLFQLGTGERATYGMKRRVHGVMRTLYATIYEQVVAAHNLWRARGWEPWTCCEG